MIVFLDVDGTYADHGVVPEAHVAAVREARARGHRVLLCTGRPACMLEALLAETHFDGIVASAGAYVEVAGKVLRDQRFSPDLASRTVDVLDLYDVTYVLESPEGLDGPPDIAARVAAVRNRQWARMGKQLPRPMIVPTPQTNPRRREARFSKVMIFEASMAVNRLGELIGTGVATIPSSIPYMSSSAGEIFLADVHKAVGARIALREFGAARQETLAVGDGLNDVEVLAWAGLGVAVEGARPQVLAAADRTVPGPERAGLAQLFDELGLTGSLISRLHHSTAANVEQPPMRRQQDK